MHQLIKRSLGLLAVGAALAFASMSPAAQAWPTAPIRLIVPYASGGTADQLSREVAARLQKELGAAVAVENQPGAGSTMATAELAQGGPGADHTVLMASSGHSIGPLLYENLGYDPVDDFRFIRNIIEVPNVMTVPANSPYDSVAAFIAAAKQKPMTFSSSGGGSSIHMSALLFMAKTGTRMTHVPLASSAEVRSSLLGGDVDVAFDNLPAVLEPIGSGQLKALAVTSSKPSPYLPGVGTLAELGADYGLTDFAITAWFGLIADDSMPPEAVARLQTAMDKIMADASFRAFVVKMGAEPAEQAGAAFRDYVGEDVRRWRRVASQAHLAD